MSSALLTCILSLSAPSACDTVVVCPDLFRDALEPWVAHREAQGHTLAFVSNLQTSDGIRAAIRRHAQGGRLRFIVLVGDAEPRMDRDPKLRARCVPTHFARAKVNVRWGSEPEIATDNWYADLDDDQLPDVAIGRLTADTPDELTRIVNKIIRYETNTNFGPWRRRVHFMAGIGGFGALADMAIEAAAKKLITDGLPPEYATSMTYGNWRSPYCPDPRTFRSVATRQFNDGCLFWVYIGHGQRRFVDWVRVPGAAYPIFSVEEVERLRCRQGAAIACFLACYTCAFDQEYDCLGEELLRREGGPVAVIGGSRVTMPYAMSCLGTELLEQAFHQRRRTLGEIVLAAKRNLVAPEQVSENRASLDGLGALVSGADLAEERLEHVQLFQLIGDPTLRINHPRPVSVSVDQSAEAGSVLQVTGVSPVDGDAVIELVVRRDRLTFRPPRRKQFDPTSSKLAAYDAVHRRANDPRMASARIPIRGGQFSVQLPIPSDARGAAHVRVFVSGDGAFAAGSSDIKIVTSRRESPQRQAAGGRPAAR